LDNFKDISKKSQKFTTPFARGQQIVNFKFTFVDVPKNSLMK